MSRPIISSFEIEFARSFLRSERLKKSTSHLVPNGDLTVGRFGGVGDPRRAQAGVKMERGGDEPKNGEGEGPAAK